MFEESERRLQEALANETSLSEMGRAYAEESRELTSLIRKCISEAGLLPLLDLIPFCALRRAEQACFALVELLVDLGPDELTERGTTSPSQIGTVVESAYEAGRMLVRWQTAFIEKQVQLGTRTVGVGVETRRKLRRTEATLRWYFPFDVMERALVSLDAALTSSSEKGQMLWRSSSGEEETSTVLLSLRAVFRLVMASVYGNELQNGSEYTFDKRLSEELNKAHVRNLSSTLIAYRSVASLAGLTEDQVRRSLEPITTTYGAIKDVAVAGHDPFRKDHPLIRRPLLLVGADHFLVTELCSVAAAVLDSLEESWMGSGTEAERATYDAARSSWLEGETKALLQGAVKESKVVTNIKWQCGTVKGEVDVALRCGDIALVLECKSHAKPVENVREAVLHAAEQVKRLKHAAESIDEMISRMNEVEDVDGLGWRQFVQILDAPVRIYIGVLARDFSTATTSLSTLQNETEPLPLYLSIPDLALIMLVLDGVSAIRYLGLRYALRNSPIISATEEELLLAEYLEVGFGGDLEERLSLRARAPGAAVDFGSIAGYLAYRNVWAAVGGTAPPPQEVARDHAIGTLSSDLARGGHVVASAVIDLLTLQPEFSQRVKDGVSLRAGYGPSGVVLELAEIPGSSLALCAVLYHLTRGQSTSPEQFLASIDEAAVEDTRVRLVHPEASFLALFVASGPYGVPSARFLGDPQVFFDRPKALTGSGPIFANE